MSDKHTWRELLYLGEYEGAHLFAAESASARLNGRGGLGHLVRYITHTEGYEVHCSCSSGGCTIDHETVSGGGECWHRREACAAYTYWLIRDGLSSRTAAEFDRLHAEWWPKREDITAIEGAHLGKSAEEWLMFYTALLDEYEARAAAAAKVSWAFGKKVAEAVLYDESA